MKQNDCSIHCQVEPMFCAISLCGSTVGTDTYLPHMCICHSVACNMLFCLYGCQCYNLPGKAFLKDSV